MAIVECIPEKKQTPSAQKGVIEYCIQPSKTLDEGEQLAYVSGHNCIPEFANESFLATQKVFGHKPDSIRFYHYVQSFKSGEKIDPKVAHEIGLELASGFGNREVLVATHIDKEHIHNHLVVCAYDIENGKKLHNNKFFLGDIRSLSDNICSEYGLDVLETYNPRKKSTRPGPKEYRAALNGNSWKMQLCVAIDYCMERCKNNEEFKSEMENLGYEVIWTPERKYITYILKDENGKEKRVRDAKLHDEKYLKENMENEFKSKLYGYAQGEKRSSFSRERNGSDKQRGMGQADEYTSFDEGTYSRNNGTEGDFGMGCDQLLGDDNKSRHGAKTSYRKGDENDNKRSDNASSGSQRESFKNNEQTNFSGRSTMVATPHSHGSTDDIGIALMGASGLGNLTNLIENDEETEEEKRQREARNAGSALGVAVGIVAGVAIGMAQKPPNNDVYEDEDKSEDEDGTAYVTDDEDEAFDITM